jgi:hypothetical protein
LFVGSARAATHTERHPVENAVAVCAIMCRSCAISLSYQ